MIKNFYGILLSLLTMCCVSCDKDSTEPIKLNVKDNSIVLLYPSNSSDCIHHYEVMGGDGSYTVECDNESLLTAKIIFVNSSRVHYLELESLSIGTAKVIIKDKSGNSYQLNVSIKNLSYTFRIIKHDLEVIGDNLTINEQNAIKELVLASFPVEVGGGYKFVYTDKNHTQGDAFIYPNVIGGESNKGTFVQERKMEDDILSTYQITMLGNQTYFFEVVPYLNGLRSTYIKDKYQFREDLTEKYKMDYPNVEVVYALQVVEPVIMQ